jgi:plasmid maintenance system antidote protein VapI
MPLPRPKPRFDGSLLTADLARRGWTEVDLAYRAKMHPRTVYRFVTGEVQTIRTADRLARAIGYSPRRYFVGVVTEPAA